MIATPDNFLTGVFISINNIVQGFVQNTYMHLISNNVTAITLIFTLYVGIIGYRFLHDPTYRANMSAVTRHLLFMLVIYTLIMTWSWYNRFFYNIFTNEPENISTLIVSATGQMIPGDSILSALDTVWGSGMKEAAALFNRADFSAFQFLIYGLAVFIVTLLMCLLALGLFLYAKLAMAICLALGPIFILFALFKATRGFFESWIEHLMNFALIPIVSSAVVALMYSTIQKTLGNFNATDSAQALSSMLAFNLVGLTTVFLLFQVLSICSALAGGVRLSSLHDAIGGAYRTLKAPRSSNNDASDKDNNKSGSGHNKSGSTRNQNSKSNKSAQISKKRANQRAAAATQNP